MNDADAAGLAEARYGAARGQRGLVIVTTLGTGIGSAFIYRGVLVPNSELGHLEIRGVKQEPRAANSARESEAVLGEGGPSDSPSSSAPSSGCSPPTCSSSAAGSARRPTSSCPGAHRHPDRPGQAAATRPASWGPLSTPGRIARPG
ncbi:MAG: ROK family protein [Nocardioides sp.]